MDFETAGKIHAPILYFLWFGIPAWLIFFPPRRVRARPFWSRPVLALFTAMAAEYGLHYGLLYPVAEAHFGIARSANSDTSVLINDPILNHDVSSSWIIVTFFIVLYLLARSVWLVCRLRASEVSLIAERASAEPEAPMLSADERGWCAGGLILWSVAIVVNAVCFGRFLMAACAKLVLYYGWSGDVMYRMRGLPLSLAFVVCVAGCLMLDFRFHFIHRGVWAIIERSRRTRDASGE